MSREILEQSSRDCLEGFYGKPINDDLLRNVERDMIKETGSYTALAVYHEGEIHISLTHSYGKSYLILDSVA